MQTAPMDDRKQTATKQLKSYPVGPCPPPPRPPLPSRMLTGPRGKAAACLPLPKQKCCRRAGLGFTRHPPLPSAAWTHGRRSPSVPKGLHPNLLHPGGLLDCTTTSPAITASGHTRNKYSLSGNICCTDFSILFSLQRKKNNPFPVCWGHPHGWDLRCAVVGCDQLPAGTGMGRSFLPGGKKEV